MKQASDNRNSFWLCIFYLQSNILTKDSVPVPQLFISYADKVEGRYLWVATDLRFGFSFIRIVICFEMRIKGQNQDQESIRQTSFKRSGENEIITGRYA